MRTSFLFRRALDIANPDSSYYLFVIYNLSQVSSSSKNTMSLKTTLIVGLLAWFGSCDANSWTPAYAKIIKIPDNVILTSKSATFLVAEGGEEIIDAESHKSHVLTFDRELGSPKWNYSCGAGKYCLQWMKDDIVQGEVIVIDPFHVPGDNPNNRWTFTVNGPPHSYFFHNDGFRMFGGPVNGIYPSDLNVLEDAPCVVTAATPSKNVFGSIAERSWYMTSGHAVQVDDDAPLFVSQNETTLTLTVKNESPFPTDPLTVSSTITLCLMQDVKTAWECIHPNYKKPIPREFITPAPSISTSVSLGEAVTQDAALDLVKQADKHSITTLLLEIDEGWESCYGNQIVDTKKFPNLKQLVSDLDKDGKVVSLSVHPFINVNCPEHNQLTQYLVRYINGTPVETTWRKGKAGIFNFMDPAAANFFANRLQGLRQTYGIAGFKFEAGEISYLDQGLLPAAPNKFCQNYAEVAARFGPNTYVKIGANTFGLNLRLQLQDRNHVWETENQGLKSIVPSLLQLTILGYGAVIPDIVGGHITQTTTVDKELLIRWIQLSTFIPSVILSYPPWKMDDETLALFQKFVGLHYKYGGALEALGFDDGPIMTPMWFVDKDSTEAHAVKDQFIVGSMLVAPVVEKGATSRDIYFPTGFWKDLETGIVYTGPTVVKNFQAPLNKLPWFMKQGLVR